MVELEPKLQLMNFLHGIGASEYLEVELVPKLEPIYYWMVKLEPELEPMNF